MVPVTWRSAWLGRVEGGAGVGTWWEKDTPACGVTGGPSTRPAIRLHREFLSFCFRMCMCARLCVCVGGGGEKKDNIQLNNLVGINPYLPGFFSPAGQRSSLRDGQRKIPFLCAGKHTDLFGWKFLVSPQSHFLSSCPPPGFTLFMNFHILDSPEKACTPNSPSWRRQSTF